MAADIEVHRGTGARLAAEGPCVVHLVRKANGPEPFERFLRSFETHRVGVEHDLLLLFKGFGSDAETRPYLERASGLGAESIRVGDRGFDLNAYLDLPDRVPRESYCFLNSFSVIQADEWLGSLAAAVGQEGVGLAGATGSWASQRSLTLYLLGLPSPYAGVYQGRRRTRHEFGALTAKAYPPPSGFLARKLLALWGASRQLVHFAGFPSYHVRTNAFLIRRETLAALHTLRIRTKYDAHRVENGRSGITREVERLGLRAVIVGRDGHAYEKQAWDESQTFWQGTQDNLLVADNQTREYEAGDRSRRLLLSRFAWGDRARPTPP